MNERIKQLVKQATLPGYMLGESYVQSSLDREKFAELIVKECITSITNNTANYQEEGIMAYYQGVQDAAKSIQEHFGVEE